MPMRLRNVMSLSGRDCGFVSGCGGSKGSPSSRSRMLRWDMMLLDYLLFHEAKLLQVSRRGGNARKCGKIDKGRQFAAACFV